MLAVSDPNAALARARLILASRPDSHNASVAHQAAGIVLRDVGDVNAGVRELRDALRLARHTGSAERESDVLAALGVALAYAGRTSAALATFERAIERSSGALTGRVLHRRGIVLWTLGRDTAALDDFSRAVTVLQDAGDLVWTARALAARGLVHVRMGSPDRADADFLAAERMFAETNQDLAAIHNVGNRALTAFARGDLPAALAFLDEAARRYRPLNLPTFALSIDRCAVLLAAGLADEALAEADSAVRDMERIRGRETRKAELLLMAARCALAAGQADMALTWGRAAYRMFQSQQSAWWKEHAAVVVVHARYLGGLTATSLLRESDRTAVRLAALGSADAAYAHLLAGRVARDLGRRDHADRHFGAAAQSRRHGSALSRASGWLGAALQAEAAGDSRRMLIACRRGLEILDEHRFTFGASELRARASAHGAELAALAQRHAALAQRPRLLLAWSERWRATALAVPAVRPPADAELSAGLVALRDVTRALDKAGQASPSAPAQRERLRLEREQLRLEREVRSSALRARSMADRGPATVAVTDLLDALGSGRLLQIVDIEGSLHVLVCGSGKVRQVTAGGTAQAARAAEFARFALRRLARGRTGPDVDGALAILRSIGPKLQEELLGPACQYLGDAPVVVVPPGKLSVIPWALLPALSGRVFGVAPSSSAWMRARASAPPARRQVTLVRGPGLATGGAEVPAVARLHDDVTVLDGAAATADQVLRSLDGAWLAHIAAHGVFRADSPLFSSLRLSDGPLTVYDFEQLRQAPYRLVLSSCDSGVQASAGADELLGLVASLLPLGTAGIVAAVTPLNDHAVVPVMVDLHRHLRAGQTLAESLLSVRAGLAGDTIAQATAASLIALGAA